MRNNSRPAPRDLILKTLFLGVLGCVSAVALGEVLTRWFVPDPAFRTDGELDLLREDSIVGYRNNPNLRGYVFGFIRLDTNSLGFRGPEISIQKAPGTYRILGLGDSVMWGVGVQEADTYLRDLEGSLQRSYGQKSGVRYEAINTGVIGYSTYQELLSLERDGLPLCPDLVILGFVHNDSYPTMDPFNNVSTIQQPVNPKAVHAARLPAAESPLRLFTFLRAAVKRRRAAQAYGSNPDWYWGLGSWHADSFAMQSWPVLQGHLRKLKSLAGENDFHLLVLLFPTDPQVTFGRGPAAYQNEVGPFLAAEKIPYIDLYGDLLVAGSTPQFVDSLHLSVAGHRTTTDSILRYLQENHWQDGVNPKTTRTCSR